jgi:hypothetical protein
MSESAIRARAMLRSKFWNSGRFIELSTSAKE